jgi:hypothetical protein
MTAARNGQDVFGVLQCLDKYGNILAVTKN